MEKTDRPIILYIDDSPESRFLVHRILARDFTVFEASDALSGFTIAVEQQPDLVLIDLNMPYINGYEAAETLQTLLPHAVLVAFSADITPETRQRALDAGCSGFLSKPFDIDTFRADLKNFLQDRPPAGRHEVNSP